MGISKEEGGTYVPLPTDEDEWDMLQGVDYTPTMRRKVVYIAGRFTEKDRLNRHRVALRKRGFEVSSSWMDEPDGLDNDTVTTEQSRNAAVRDLDEINECDILILDTFGEGGGGRFVEWGFAEANDKLLLLVGPKVSVFDTLAFARLKYWNLLDVWLDNVSTWTRR